MSCLMNILSTSYLLFLFFTINLAKEECNKYIWNRKRQEKEKDPPLLSSPKLNYSPFSKKHLYHYSNIMISRQHQTHREVAYRQCTIMYVRELCNLN